MYRIVFLSVFFSVVINPRIKSQTPCMVDSAGIYACDKIDLLAFMPKANVGASGSTKCNDIWGWTHEASGREFVILGLTRGTSFIEITDPLNPIYLGRLERIGSTSSWRDMKTYDNYVYIVSENSYAGIQIFDLNTLLTASPSTTFTTTASANIAVNPSPVTRAGNAHNIISSVESKYMYIVGNSQNPCSGGMEYFNISDPLNPVREGCYSAEGYCHDAVCFIYQGPDTEHVGKEICIGSNTNKQVVLDMSDKSNVTTLDVVTYPNDGYTHQGWMTDDHKYVLFNDEGDERAHPTWNTRTHIMNIEDLDNSFYVGYYEHPVKSIDHNCFVKGQYLYEANYQSGLRILDLSDVANGNLSTAAYFDTYPTSNASAFNGSWGVYPYFKNGTIAVSNMEHGLFLLRPQLPHFLIDGPDTTAIINANEDVVIELNLDSLYGYNNLVDLTVSGIPSGASASFSNNAPTSFGQSTLTITNTCLLSGNYSLLVSGRGQNDNKLHDVSVSFNIIPFPSNIILSEETFLADLSIEATQSITLDQITIDPLVTLILKTPQLIISNNLKLEINSQLIWKQENPCPQN